jgi:hypothetical protein
MHAPQDTITYFRTSFNTKKKKVIEFFIVDTTNNYKVDPVVFACSVDPLAHKYPDISPYAFVANSPIIFIDPDGRENIIYLVALPSAYSKLSVQNVTDIINQANANFKSQGLDTRVVLFNDISSSTIDPDKRSV